MDSRRESFLQILTDKPRLHHWPSHGGWSYGGFDDAHLTWMFDRLARSFEGGAHTTIESGAGLSTLVLLATRPRRHICICPDRELQERVLASVRHFGLDEQRLEYLVEASEDVLPQLTAGPDAFLDFALIDGGHGFPTVFVDFCYMNRALKSGGTLLVDDTQILPVHELACLLDEQPGWSRIHTIEKLAIYEKQNDRRYLPDFGAQPYVQRNRLSSSMVQRIAMRLGWRRA